MVKYKKAHREWEYAADQKRTYQDHGRAVNVVIWTGDPLTTVGAEASMTILEGKIVYPAD